jgi:hypothetical protein
MKEKKYDSEVSITTADAAFNPATPQDLQHSRADINSRNSHNSHN